MPGITQSMGGSDSKYLKHCIKKGKVKDCHTYNRRPKMWERQI
jgi:hypothetical protein